MVNCSQIPKVSKESAIFIQNFDKMTDRIDKIIVEKEDSVRIYCLCANCEREIKVIGKGKVSKNEDVYII